MRVLLDECLPRDSTRAMPGFDTKTTRQMGWLGIKNGRLLKLIGDAACFDVFVTVDKNLRYQQNLAEISFANVVLRLKSNRVDDVLAHVPELLRRLPQLKPGEVVVLSLPGTKTIRQPAATAGGDRHAASAADFTAPATREVLGMWVNPPEGGETCSPLAPPEAGELGLGQGVAVLRVAIEKARAEQSRG